MEKKKDNRGGLRPNNPGGRPKKVRNFSEEIKKDVIAALKRKAKSDKLTFGDLLIQTAWGEGHFALKATAMKLIAEILVVKETKQTTEQIAKPTIALPATLPKPKELEDELRVH